MTSRREHAATAATGTALLATGATMRSRGTERGWRGVGRPKPGWVPRKPLSTLPSAALFQHGAGARSRALYAAGTGLATVGGIAAGSGTVGLVRSRKVRKSQTPFVTSGIRGTHQAVEDKLRNMQDKQTPKTARAIPWAVGTTAAALGAQAGHTTFDRLARHSRLRPAATAIAGTAAVASSLPISNRILQHSHPDYQVTPTGVKRRKRPLVRPSRHATTVDARGGSKRASRAAIVPSSVGKAMVELKHDQHYQRHVAKMLVPLSPREQQKLANRKRRSATLSVLGGVTGTAALGALGASKLKLLKPAVRARAAAAQTPLLTAGAGAGGINAFLGAGIQRKEAAQTAPKKTVIKSMPDPSALHVPTGLVRTKTMRAGAQVTRRNRSGILVSTRRGGVG